MNLYESYPPNSKVWIYQSDRAFTDQEVDWIKSVGSEFTGQWNSHGSPVRGELTTLFNRFIVVVADEQSSVSGCSIDSSVGVIRQIQDELKIDLFNRLILTYRSGDLVEAVHANDLEEAVKEGKLSANTTVFNNLVTDLEGLRNEWMIPLEKSWAWSRVSSLV